jgi:hypothetical protein
MNPRLLLLTLSTFCALGGLCCPAQKITPIWEPQKTPNAVSDSIKEFFDALNSDGQADKDTTQDPPTVRPPEPATPPNDAKDGASPQAADAPKPEPPPAAIADAEASAEPQSGLTVQVEKLQTGKGAIDPKTVKLLAPFPAKPLDAIPPGWRLDASTSAPPFTRNVDLAPGASITLSIRPHLLIPDADGASAFSITEPGFNPALGYRQAQTVSAVLATSIQQLDEDAKQLGNAIDQLQQLVSSLPRPAAMPLPPPATPPTTPTTPTKRPNRK